MRGSLGSELLLRHPFGMRSLAKCSRDVLALWSLIFISHYGKGIDAIDPVDESVDGTGLATSGRPRVRKDPVLLATSQGPERS